jgi:hypothetical protein
MWRGDTGGAAVRASAFLAAALARFTAFRASKDIFSVGLSFVALFVVTTPT